MAKRLLVFAVLWTATASAEEQLALKWIDATPPDAYPGEIVWTLPQDALSTLLDSLGENLSVSKACGFAGRITYTLKPHQRHDDEAKFWLLTCEGPGEDGISPCTAELKTGYHFDSLSQPLVLQGVELAAAREIVPMLDPAAPVGDEMTELISLGTTQPFSVSAHYIGCHCHAVREVHKDVSNGSYIPSADFSSELCI